MRTERSRTGESFVSTGQKSGGHMTCYLATYIIKRRSMSYRTSGGNCTAIAINPGRAMTLSLTGRSKLPTSVYGRCAWNISYVATLKMPCPRYASVEIQPAASQESRSKPHSKRHHKNLTEGDKLSDLYCILQYKRV